MRPRAQQTDIVFSARESERDANKRLVRPFDRHRRGAGAGSCLRCILLVKFNYIFGPSRSLEPTLYSYVPVIDNNSRLFPRDKFLAPK